MPIERMSLNLSIFNKPMEPKHSKARMKTNFIADVILQIFSRRPLSNGFALIFKSE